MSVESRKAFTQEIHAAVDAVLAEGLPADVNEREAFCMEHIQMGEALAADPARTLDAALAFYKALKVYPTPHDLINIYDKVVDKVSHANELLCLVPGQRGGGELGKAVARGCAFPLT